MKKTYLALMKWPGARQPVCVGNNKKLTKQTALKMMKEEYGTESIVRPGAMCSAPLAMDDIVIEEIPFITT